MGYQMASASYIFRTNPTSAELSKTVYLMGTVGSSRRMEFIFKVMFQGDRLMEKAYQ